MSLLALPRRSSHRPQGMTINSGHPLANKLYLAWEFAAQAGGKTIADLSRMGHAAAGEGTSNWLPTPLGMGYKAASGSSNGVYTDRNHNTSTYTIAMAIMPTDTTASANLAGDSWGAIASGTHSNDVNIYSDSKYEFYLWDGGGKAIYSTTTALGYRVDHIVATATPGAMKLYVNGKLEASNLAIGTPYTHGFVGYYVAGRNTSFGGANVVHIYNRVWTRVLSEDEVKWLYAEPWGLYVAPRRYWFGGTTAVTASPGTVAMSLSLLAPTPRVRPLPGSVSLSAALLAPRPRVRSLPGVVTTSTSLLALTPKVRALPSVVTTTASLLAPTPRLRALPSVVSLATATQAPTPIVRALPSSVALATTLYAPTFPRTVAPGVVTLTASSQAPTPRVRALPSVVSLAASLLAPTPRVRVLPGVVALTLTPYAPTGASGAVTATPAAVALAFGLLAPTAQIRALPAAASLTAAPLAPTPALRGLPASVAVSLGLLAPSIRVRALPGSVALVVTVYDPVFAVLAAATFVALTHPTAFTALAHALGFMASAHAVTFTAEDL